MTKKDFIALADTIRYHNERARQMGIKSTAFDEAQLNTLARFCQAQNNNFMQERWMDYIKGKCGPNGGAVKKAVKK